VRPQFPPTPMPHVERTEQERLTGQSPPAKYLVDRNLLVLALLVIDKFKEQSLNQAFGQLVRWPEWTR